MKIQNASLSLFVNNSYTSGGKR